MIKVNPNFSRNKIFYFGSIACLLLFYLFPLQANASLFSHIKTGFYLLNGLSGDPNRQDAELTFLGDHYDILVWSQNNEYNTTRLYTQNPNIEVYHYIGASVSRWQDWYSQYPSTQFQDFLDWCKANGKNYEDVWWHYQDDMQYGSGQPYQDWSKNTLVSGFQPGLIPGWKPPDSPTTDHQATIRANSRVYGSPSFYNPATVQKSISTIVGAGGTVTVKTTASHTLQTDDRITISGTTNFNGSYNITKVDAYTFSFPKAGNIAQEASGTVTYNTIATWYSAINSQVKLDWLAYRMGNLDHVLVDKVGNKANGYYFDSWTNQITWGSAVHLEKTDQYIADGATNLNAWLRSKYLAEAATMKANTQAFLAGSGKVARFTGNADHLDYVGDTKTANSPLYATTGGLDVAIMEYGLWPQTLSVNWLTIPKLKQAQMDEETYGKRLIWETWSNAKIYSSEFPMTWTNAGIPGKYVWYTTDLQTTITPWQLGNDVIGIAGTGDGYGCYGCNGLASSLETISQGQIYFDPNTKRVYAWFGKDGNPNGQNIYVGGGDMLRHWGLALYYAFGRNGEYGYYFPWGATGAAYNKEPSVLPASALDLAMTWHPSIEYNIGQPAAGGKDYKGNSGSDVWGNSRSVSNKAYLFWRGNNSTGESGDGWSWTSDAAPNNTHDVYARKFDNGYAFFRLLAGDLTSGEHALSKPVTFQLPFSGKILNADGTLGPTTDTITIRQSQGVILITSSGSVDNIPPAAPTGVAVN